MKNMGTAFRWFKKKEGLPLHKALSSSISAGTEKQVKYANDLFDLVLADTQGKLNYLFNVYNIHTLDQLKEAYERKEDTPFYSIEIMIEKLCELKNASTIIEAFKGDRNIRKILRIYPEVEKYFLDNDINF